MAVIVLLAIVGSLFGLLSLSQATAGVGIIAFSCLLAIFGRIAQADKQHEALQKALEEKSVAPGVASTETRMPL